MGQPHPTPPLPQVDGVELLTGGSLETVDRHWNLAVLSDGFAGDLELALYRQHVEDLRLRLLIPDLLIMPGLPPRRRRIPPFDRMPSAINIFRFDVRSPESWSSAAVTTWCAQHQQAAQDEPDPTRRATILREMACGVPAPRTAFNSRFCRGGLARALVGNTDLVRRTVSHPLWPLQGVGVDPGAGGVVGNRLRPANVHGILVLVNNDKLHGGAASGGVAWVSLFGPNKQWHLVAVHELGHQAFQLADEYHFLGGADEHRGFTGGRPRAPNVTSVLPLPAGKAIWRRLLTPGVPMPTSRRPAVNACPALTAPDQLDHGTFDVPAEHTGSVGAFEGADRRLCGVFRPALNCIMRRIELEKFCPVCEQAIVEELGRRLFDRARTRPERPIDNATHVVPFTPADGSTDARFLAYDGGSGAFAIYPCRPFVAETATPTPVRGAITPFWTSLVPTEINRVPHLLATQPGSAQAGLYRLAADGSALTQVWHTPGVALPSPTLGPPQNVVPFTFNNQPHYLEYDPVAGVATVRRIDVVQPQPITVRTVPWGVGVLGFSPFTLPDDDRQHFVSYNVVNGTTEIKRFDRDDVTAVWGAPGVVPAGYTTCMPFMLSGLFPHLLFHSRLTGDLQIYRVRRDGQGIDFVFRDTASGTGLFLNFAPFRLRRGAPYYLRHRLSLLGQPTRVAAFHCG